jgi:hypothetical protein
VGRFPTLELDGYGRRAAIMATTAPIAMLVDFGSKSVAVALGPRTLLFNVSTHSPAGLGEGLIVVLAACSLLACVLPVRVVALGAGVALGGALGNLMSRHLWATAGGSPDFIPFADGSTGNVADLFVSLGAIAMLLGAVLWVALTAFRGRPDG